MKLSTLFSSSNVIFSIAFTASLAFILPQTNEGQEISGGSALATYLTLMRRCSCFTIEETNSSVCLSKQAS